jgi:hypothetical protein
MLNIDPARRAKASDILNILEDIDVPKNPNIDETIDKFANEDMDPNMFDNTHTPMSGALKQSKFLDSTVVLDQDRNLNLASQISVTKG